MSDLLDLSIKISDTQETIRMIEKGLADFPGDQGMTASLHSLLRRAESLEAEFIRESNRKQVDVCSYRIFPDNPRPQSILEVGTALADFQRWFSTLYDAIKTGPKKIAKLAAETLSESRLDFGFTYTGSVGVVMTIPSERALFGTPLQTAMLKSVELLGTTDRETLHQFSRELGAATIRALYTWLKDHADSGSGADLAWVSGEKVLAEVRANHSQLRALGTMISETSEVKEEEFEIIGWMVGADTTSRTFHMAFHEGEEIRGSLSDSIGEDFTIEIPTQYQALIQKHSSTKYTTDQETVRYILLGLKRL